MHGSASLASLTRETGPKLVRGDPARNAEVPEASRVHHVTPTISVSDSALKFTHVLYNLSPAGTYNLKLLSLYMIYPFGLANNCVPMQCICRAVWTGHQVWEGIVHYLGRGFGHLVWCQNWPLSEGQEGCQRWDHFWGAVVGQVRVSTHHKRNP